MERTTYPKKSKVVKEIRISVEIKSGSKKKVLHEISKSTDEALEKIGMIEQRIKELNGIV